MATHSAYSHFLQKLLYNILTLNSSEHSKILQKIILYIVSQFLKFDKLFYPSPFNLSTHHIHHKTDKTTIDIIRYVIVVKNENKNK